MSAISPTNNAQCKCTYVVNNIITFYTKE